MSELRAYEDLDLFGAECTSALEELEQDVYHRLIERKGSNLDDINRGCAVDEWLSTSTTSEVAKARIEADIRQDDRVQAVTVTIEELLAGERRILIEIQTDDEELARIDLLLDAEGLRGAA